MNDFKRKISEFNFDKEEIMRKLRQYISLYERGAFGKEPLLSQVLMYHKAKGTLDSLQRVKNISSVNIDLKCLLEVITSEISEYCEANDLDGKPSGHERID